MPLYLARIEHGGISPHVTIRHMEEDGTVKEQVFSFTMALTEMRGWLTINGYEHQNEIEYFEFWVLDAK